MEAYRRDSRINPDPDQGITDSYENPIGDRYNATVTFKQKIEYCLKNKSVPFLHLCKRSLGQETEVAITSNIRSELKRYDRMAGVFTMETLASKIPGFKYETRSINNQVFRVVCGPKSKFIDFLDCEISE